MMDFILNLIGGSGIWGYVVAGVTALGSILGVYFKGRSDAKRKAETKSLKEYQSTRKRMDDAKGSSGDKSDDIDWLKDYGEN